MERLAVLEHSAQHAIVFEDHHVDVSLLAADHLFVNNPHPLQKGHPLEINLNAYLLMMVQLLHLFEQTWPIEG